jgi:hypothetical protein
MAKIASGLICPTGFNTEFKCNDTLKTTYVALSLFFFDERLSMSIHGRG